MENEDLFSKGIGNKEKTALKPKPVVIQGVVPESIMGKKGSKNEGKEVGKKLVLICKHPDSIDPIKISEMKFIKGSTVTTSTVWINVDEDGLIQKGSHVANLLEFYKVDTVNNLVGKAVNTELDQNNYLCVRVY